MKTVHFTFGPVTASEVETMLTASAESGDEMAATVLRKTASREFELSADEARWLSREMMNDADRVRSGINPAAGNAFERAGMNLARLAA